MESWSHPLRPVRKFGGQVLWGPDHKRLRRYHPTRSLWPTGISARLSGDEFIILLRYGKRGRRNPRHRRITRVLETPLAMKGHELYITASIVMVVSTSGGERLDDLWRNAGAAIYRTNNSARRPGTWCSKPGRKYSRLPYPLYAANL